MVLSDRTSMVYPRVCGGANIDRYDVSSRAGLSPRVRGSPISASPRLSRPRSIPACAGEPLPGTAPGTLPAVYPRVCGGAARRGFVGSVVAGLSPRVRGSQGCRVETPGWIGSIPACAGEPLTCSSLSPPAKVYPRVCGGATRRSVWTSRVGGLSPRVRGSHEPIGIVRLGFRSIPACAGEPAFVSRRASPNRVYPRVCGGAVPSGSVKLPPLGLSPRVRGSLAVRLPDRAGRGSIPACAGEPTSLSGDGSYPGVYPRVCGGAASAAHVVIASPGLSPRVRGSRSPTAHLRP